MSPWPGVLCTRGWSLLTENMPCPLNAQFSLSFLPVVAPVPVCSVSDHCWGPEGLAVGCAAVVACSLPRYPAGSLPSSHPSRWMAPSVRPCFREGILSLCFSQSLHFFVVVTSKLEMEILKKLNIKRNRWAQPKCRHSCGLPLFCSSVEFCCAGALSPACISGLRVSRRT